MATPGQQGRIERRLAAILAADIAGYSRLMGADEAGTARALREHRAAIDPIVVGHGGRIVKTAGDGVLLEFPSIVAAVECAPSRSNPSEAVDRRSTWRHGQKKPRLRAGLTLLPGPGGTGGWGTEPAMQANNAHGPSWFHRRPKGSTCLIAGNRRRPSGIGAVGRSLSAALWAGRGATPRRSQYSEIRAIMKAQ